MIEKVLSIFVERSRMITLILVLMVFAISVAVGLSSGDRMRYPDERDYTQLAQQILDGKGYVDEEGIPTAFRPPGWPLVLAGVYHLWNRPLAAKLFNAAAYTLCAWLLSILVGRVAPEGRVFAPLLILAYPVGFYTASTLYPQTLGTALLVAVILLLGNRRHVALSSVCAGLLYGALLLSIPAFLLLIPLVILGVAIDNRRDAGTFLSRSFLYLLCAMLVVAPWSIRNAQLFDRFVPISTNSGFNLLLGNSENTRPNSGVNVDISHYQEHVEGMDEAEVDAMLRQFAVDHITKHPGRSAGLYVRKVLNYFNFRNELYAESEQSRLRNVIMFVSYYPLLLIAIVRLGAYKRYHLSTIEILAYLLYFGSALTSAIFFTRIRFRIPMDALLIAVVAGYLGLFLRTWRTRRTEAVDAGSAD